jgi:predicted permease
MSRLTALLAAALKLRRHPGLAVGAALSLSLALAGAAILFTIVDVALLHPLPYPEQERIVAVRRAQGPQRIGPPVSGPAFLDLARRQTSFSAFAASTGATVVLTGSGGATRLLGARVSAQYFDVLGMPLTQGRAIAAIDFPGGTPAPVAMLSERAWQLHFGAAPDIVGRTITLDGSKTTVIGVAPAGLLFPGRAEIAVPLALPADGGARGNNSLNLIGRLAPGVGIDAAQAEFERLAQQLAEEHPENHAELHLPIQRIVDRMTAATREVAAVLAAAIALLGLVGSASLINLVLADVLGRRREFATRAAIGASRGRLFGQFAAECVALTTGAALLALLLAQFGLAWLRDSDLAWLARPEDLRLSGVAGAATLLVAVALGALTAVVTGRDLGAAPAQGLRSGARAGGLDPARQRLRRLLVSAQIGLSLVLLIGAGVLVVSLARLTAESPGFDPARLAAMYLSLPADMVEDGSGDAAEDARRRDRRTAFLQRVESSIAALPQVQQVGLGFHLPVIDGSGTNGDLAIVGDPPADAGKAPLAEFQLVTPGYFDTLGVALIAGRGFRPLGQEGRDTVLVNQELVRRHFGGRDPLGHKLLIADGRERSIVGVVADVRQDGYGTSPQPEVYFPYDALTTGDVALLLRSEASLTELVTAVRSEVARIDARVPVFQPTTMSDAFAKSTAQRRFLLSVMGLFALAALAIAAIGLYAVFSHAVTLRQGEFGVRMALGAATTDVRRLVAREAALLVGVGLALGVGAAVALSGAAAHLVYGVSAREPWIYLGQSLLLSLVAAVALLRPIWRAGRIPPSQALRDE